MDNRQQRQQINLSMNEQEATVTSTTATNAVLVFVNRPNSGSDDPQGGSSATASPRPLPEDSEEEIEEFLQEFDELALDLIRKLRRYFPYEQKIKWSLDYGNGRKHKLEVIVRPSRSMNR